jgi:hypothetical protein
MLYPPIDGPIVLHPHDWCAQLTAFSDGGFWLTACFHNGDACRVEIPRFAGEADERILGITDREVRRQSRI